MKRKIINLTQHTPLPAQIAEGVFSSSKHEEIRGLLTFHEAPTTKEMIKRALELSVIAREEGAEYALIGGAPYFMPILEKVLLDSGIIPLYAFSRRQVEEVTENGTTKKIVVFHHERFIPASMYKICEAVYQQGLENMPSLNLETLKKIKDL